MILSGFSGFRNRLSMCPRARKQYTDQKVVKNMAARKYNYRGAFTLVEVLVTALAAVILILGISAMLFYGQRGYNTLYRRINSEVVRNAYEARRLFDAIVRKSTVERCDILSPDEINGEIFLYYYYDETAPEAPEPVDSLRYMYPYQPNRFARFYVTDTGASEQLELFIERGQIPLGANLFSLDPTSLRNTGTGTLLAKHVVSCQFRNTGSSAVQMVLTLDDETNPSGNVYSETQTVQMVVTTTAVRHNKIRE